MVKLLIKNYKLIAIFSVFLALEIALMIFLFSFFSFPVSGGSGGNVTVQTTLNVGNVAPEVLLVVITNTSTSYTKQNVTLNPGSNRTVYCNGVARDWNNNTEILNVTANLFQNGTSEFAVDDNNTHYTNNSCYINSNLSNSVYGDDSTGNFTVNYSCSFNVQYYANSGPWNCSVYAYDIYNWNGSNSSLGYVNELLAVTLPSSIDYGTVNSTYVSNEVIANVSNAGNVMINLTLQGYAVSVGDGWAMNCTKGNLKNISVMYEKYNLTASTPTVTGLSDFETYYTNLTNASTTKRFNLNFRQNEGSDDAINATYWRIYVPRGVAGSCSGNIIFGAIKANGTG
jgi:hypothetical protein